MLPVLERELGPGVAAALARSAALPRADADALDDLAATAAGEAAGPAGDLDVAVLAALLPALRGRVLRAARAGRRLPGGALPAGHVRAVDALVIDWHGQAGVDLPGGVDRPAAPVTGSRLDRLWSPAKEADRGDRRARGAAGGQGPRRRSCSTASRSAPGSPSWPRRSTPTTPAATCCWSASSRAR